ncbi:unnamed protein product [Rotaria magnacalcarata]|uniref:VCBS repeat-containing protein n=2 Tax=Rotaria magnacalcarata TaxID=392030 RepID=A0A8S2PZW9_9BILA|nr:unnamed protein product [Rotaria magnacalcarata]
MERELLQNNRLDLLATNKGTYNIAVLIGDGNGTFANPKMYSTGATSPISLAVGDINKDSRLNVIVVSNDTGALNIPFGSFEGLENQVNYSADSSPYAVTIGDLNNDGTLGIIIANDNSNDILTSSNPYVVAIGDLNNDTRLDIVVANYHSDALSVLLGHGNGSFANENRYDTGFMPASIANGDFNNDTRLDTAVANCSGDDVSVLLGYGNGSFAN